MKKYSASLTIKEMQIKTTLRFHLTPECLSSITETTINAGNDAWKKKPLSTLVTTMEHSMEDPKKTKNRPTA
jgi:hypothetical protein